MTERGGVRVEWEAGEWTHAPLAVDTDGRSLIVTAKEGSDAWRHTSYGFVHDSEHALLAPFTPGSAVEVELTADFAEQFDQAGIFIRASVDHWVKAGVEYADGILRVGAVVTNPCSDWSVAAVEDWAGQRILIRASWTGDALVVRAGATGRTLQLVRVLPFTPHGAAAAGPFTCAPTRAGLVVRFHDWRVDEPDLVLH